VALCGASLARHPPPFGQPDPHMLYLNRTNSPCEIRPNVASLTGPKISEHKIKLVALQPAGSPLGCVFAATGVPGTRLAENAVIISKASSSQLLNIPTLNR